MKPTLSSGAVTDLIERIERAQEAHARHYPGDAEVRQPVHTVYVPADRFSDTLVADYGAEARRLLDTYAADGASLAAAVGADPATQAGPRAAGDAGTSGGSGDVPLADQVRERVADKLVREPVEDLRLDFEDGYGARDDAVEDADIERAVGSAASAWADGTLPPFFGLRIKSYADGLYHRSIRTLDLFLTLLLDHCGRLPEGFVVTLPKVTMPEHVAAFVELLGRLEETLGLPEGTLRFEIQVETTESIVNHRGEIGLRRMVREAGHRLCGAHFGVFDYTTACGLPAEEQRLTHPACDFARHAMQVAVAGTGVRLSDGSTNVVPAAEDTTSVHAAWRTLADQVRHSLQHGYYQGWDMHPSHLPARFAVVYAFHISRLPSLSSRLRAWNERSGGEGLVEEPATVRAMLGQLQRAVDCGAVSETEVLERTGVPSLQL